MFFSFNGKSLTGPQGLSGSDGSPIGTVISYLGTKAPEGYLICDGSEYQISQYSQLAGFIKENYEVVNYFGGDGVNTFCVPDMRNLFLRGYHGEMAERLSAEIGDRQEATTHPGVVSANSGDEIRIISVTNNVTPSNSDPQNIDDVKIQGTKQFIVKSNNNIGEITSSARPYSYTSRPVNMAVLYCIKAIESVSSGLEEYDTDDGWHVRKYSDGYVEFFGTFDFTIKKEGWNAWGQIYSLGADYSISNKNYPLQLIEIYDETFNVTYPFDGALIILYRNRINNNSTKQYGLARSSALTYDINTKIHYHVMGRWK